MQSVSVLRSPFYLTHEIRIILDCHGSFLLLQLEQHDLQSSERDLLGKLLGGTSRGEFLDHFTDF